ncbi:MAG: DeoR/GlpR family DNA-binding transcription regulator [Alphaproteobacteria bacterium]
MTGRLTRSERFERIVAELRASSTVRISALADAFGVSTETVRRDIDELSRRGLVDRTYGGAAARAMAREPAVNERHRLLVEERLRIGACAAKLVEPGEVLMIDSGSTTTHFARRLAAAGSGLTVLTNCIAVALALGQNPSVRVILCPGDYNPREGGAFGAETAAFLRGFHADKAFIGASGLTVDGPVEVDSAASWVKRAMIERAERRVLLVDQTKFEARSLELVCPLSDIDDVVADAEPGHALGDALAAAGVTFHLAE